MSHILLAKLVLKCHLQIVPLLLFAADASFLLNTPLLSSLLVLPQSFVNLLIRPTEIRI
jgi:hypothetical protein